MPKKETDTAAPGRPTEPLPPTEGTSSDDQETRRLPTPEAPEEAGDRVMSVGRMPSSIGPFRLLEPLGRGGMGEVYLAEQTTPVRRRVALKLIKPGMDTRDVVARFEAERQALAVMDHPHIAKVFDAGATDSGRPYFAMELVRGLPLNRYCDQHRLTIRQRIELFVLVCRAVQHAHQKGVIHRDLKPSNVLVSVQGEELVPKIIDFGIAKAMDHRLSESTLFTELGQLMGTPEYMSPEQAEMSGLDIDTRADIYSLGVMLYELLAGSLPYDSESLRRVSFVELQRVLRETDFPRPSRRIAATPERAEQVARARRTTPARLEREVYGDLDWIVLKATDKDRTRRYETADALAQDLRRFLDDEAVLARPPSPWYRLGKLARRHRTAVFAGAAILSALLVGLVGTTLGLREAERARAAEAEQRREAERQAATARTVSDFLRTDLLAAVRPEEAQGREVTVREVLDRASQEIAGRFDEQGEVEAALRHTVANSYQALGELDEAARHYESSYDLRREELGTEHPDTVATAIDLGGLYTIQGRYERAEELLSAAVAATRRRSEEDPRLALVAMNHLAALYDDMGRLGEAESLYREILERRREVLGGSHPDTLVAMNDLATLLDKQGRLPEALALMTDLVEIRRREEGAEHPDTLIAMNNLAGVYFSQERYREAADLHRRILDVRRRILGDRHPDTLLSMNNLGTTLGELEAWGDARRLMEEALQGYRLAFGEGHPSTLATMKNLADVYAGMGRADEAERMMGQAIDAARQHLPAGHWYLGVFLGARGRVLLSLDRFEEAERLLLEAEENLTAALGADHERVAEVERLMAQLHERSTE